jgi:hypothetical protein
LSSLLLRQLELLKTIYWEYSKLIAKAVGFDKDYGSIMSRAKLESGQINFSELDKDDRAAIKSNSIL